MEFNNIYNFMKEELLKRSYIQADETTLKVIDARGQDSKSTNYMWLYRSGGTINPIILYEYQKTRSGSCLKNFLRDFSGYLQTDGYAGYNKVTTAKRLYCLAHIRRKYYDIVSILNEEALKKSRAVIGFNFCEQIYKIEKEIKNLYSNKENFFEIRKEIRNEKIKPLLESFQKYVEEETKNALPKSPLGKALEYTTKFLPKMSLVCENGALEIDNNGVERSIKPFVIGRKNWLFSNSSKGAKSSAILYSLIETAKANGLVIEKYFLYLMNELSKLNGEPLKSLGKLMPWSEEIPKELKVIAPEKQNI